MRAAEPLRAATQSRRTDTLGPTITAGLQAVAPAPRRPLASAMMRSMSSLQVGMSFHHDTPSTARYARRTSVVTSR
jgi:hypothetical protein